MIYPSASQKSFEHVGTCEPVDILRHPGIFLSDLRIIALEPLRRLAKDAQVHVEENPGVCR